jgi:glycosyltransferase involved in cell wall biosynthesis
MTIEAPGPGSLLVIVPAYNEQGAVGDVVRELEQQVPGVPVLVIDDCSMDATVEVARAAGARILPLPHHLGLGGAVQAGYKLAFELGFEYVIRVDGDGQHDPRDIPRILDKLKESGAEMVIGARMDADRTRRMRTLGARFWAKR